jgi:hypothetical protein
MRLTDDYTLILPVPPELYPKLGTVRLGPVELRPKVELHMTVFGYSHAKSIKTAIEKEPALREVVNEAVAQTSWVMEPTSEYLLLRRAKKDKPVLYTVVNLLTLPTAASERLCERLPLLFAELLSSAILVPHVTLLTSDPEGKYGVGINSRAELDFALGRREGTASYSAYPFCPDLLGASLTIDKPPAIPVATP